MLPHGHSFATLDKDRNRTMGSGGVQQLPELNDRHLGRGQDSSDSEATMLGCSEEGSRISDSDSCSWSSPEWWPTDAFPNAFYGTHGAPHDSCSEAWTVSSCTSDGEAGF